MKLGKKTSTLLIIVAFVLGYGTEHLHNTKGNPITKKTKIWTIGILKGDSPFSFSSSPDIVNPVITAEDVTDINASFVADPFMIKVDSVWYMFFEVGNAENNHQGDIGFATSKDGIKWNYQKIVLDEDFHLSYPLVFEHDGEYYMVPESSESFSVRLYKADEFPYKWSFQNTLVLGNYLDPTLYYENNKWWMFVGTFTMGTQNVMQLFYADSLEGPYISHPQNPIVRNSFTSSRPAGRIIKEGNEIIRYAQITTPCYGTGVNAFKITKLNTEEYSEEPVSENPILYSTKSGWNSIGMHQIDPSKQSDNTWIACVDGFGLYRKWGFFW